MNIQKRRPGESGQGLIEYIILVALIALVSVVATQNLGKKVKSKMNEIKDAFDSRVVVNGGKSEGLGKLGDIADKAGKLGELFGW